MYLYMASTALIAASLVLTVSVMSCLLASVPADTVQRDLELEYLQSIVGCFTHVDVRKHQETHILALIRSFMKPQRG